VEPIATHGTRPWRTFGQRLTESTEGACQEGAAYTSCDIRFMTRGDALHATILGVLTAQIAIEALGRASPHERRPIRSVHMLGVSRPLRFAQQDTALLIEPLQPVASRHVCGFRICF
jgi:alpha-L-fucosidase